MENTIGTGGSCDQISGDTMKCPCDTAATYMYSVPVYKNKRPGRTNANSPCHFIAKRKKGFALTSRNSLVSGNPVREVMPPAAFINPFFIHVPAHNARLASMRKSRGCALHSEGSDFPCLWCASSVDCVRAGEVSERCSCCWRGGGSQFGTRMCAWFAHRRARGLHVRIGS